MKIDEALPLLKNCVGKSFRELFADLPIDLRTNKGNVGQLLLLKIGLPLDSNLKDFDDGELKTNKSDKNGAPLETMFITQISQQIDTLLSKDPLPFEQSHLFEKISRLVFLPVFRDAENREDWYFVDLLDCDLRKNNALKIQLEQDYYDICEQLKQHIKNSDDGYIHTSNGEFIQIRSKDSKPYHPIFSKIYNKYISNKNHAFYFKKDFMNYIRNLK